MKLEHKQSEITTSQNFKEIEFGIKQADMGLVLEILRSKMYKNPIGAICREVASNSRDANREAENNIPIEIIISNNHLNISDLTISFKDAGHGITPERMADVFVNYGSSTKRNSDVYTGGFGLGAKTPFSYTDNFSIETVVASANGNLKYSYVAAIEEGRKGKIYLINTSETQESTGTSIIVPIKEQDRYTFEKEVYRSTYFWSMRPTYKNFKLKEIDVTSIHDDEKFLIINTQVSNLFQNGYGLLLDGIFYNIDPNIINWANKNVYNRLYVFKFNVGELTISANREALQYDDKTKAAINKRFVELITLCKDKYFEEFKTNDTWLKAVLAFKEKDSNNYFSLIKVQCQESDPWFKSVKSFNGVTLDTTLSAAFKYLQFFKCSCDYASKVTREKITHATESLLLNPIFLFDQTPTYQTTRDATIFKKKSVYIAVKVDSKFYGWEKKTLKEKKAVVKNLREIKEDIENLSKCGLTYSKYSTVDKMKVVKTPGSSSGPVLPKVNQGIKVYVANIKEPKTASHSRRYRTTYENNCFYSRLEGLELLNHGTIDPADYAVQLVEDVWVEPNIHTEEFQMLRLAMGAGLIPEFKVIYANEKRGAFLLDTFTSLSDKLKLLTDDIITQIIDGGHINEIINDYEVLLDVKYKSKTFSNTAKTLKSMKKNVTIKSHLITDDLKKKYEHLSKIQNLKEDWCKIKEVCPLINNISSYSLRNLIEPITQYINLVEDDLISKGLLK